MEKICDISNVWDLHIHTCKCPKASGDFKKMSVSEYIEKINNIFQKYSDLKMISFTDHNRISIDVYKAFKEVNTTLKVIPGIEVDTYLYDEDYQQRNGNYKHIIIYFDDDKFNLEMHGEKINKKIEDGPVYIYDLLDFLITELHNIPFLLSPHFLKQASRSIDYDWTESEITQNNINKYIDQLFCFWETSSTKNITKAIEFLREYDLEQKVSIISFSDSNTFSKLEDYLNNPKQYFNALSNFEGLRMVGTDCRRIKRNKQFVTINNKGNYIGKVIQGENEILFSNKLNTIIGGRGSGKSLLIDGISLSLDDNYERKQYVNKKRLDYLKKLNYKVFNMKGEPLSHHNFKFDYFNQGYILKLFEDNTDIVASQYFKEEFNSLEEYSPDTIKGEILDEYAFSKENEEMTQDNITAIISKNKVFSSQKNEYDFKLIKKEETILPYGDYLEMMEALNKPKITPKELIGNQNVIKAKNELIRVIFSEQNKLNQQKLTNNINACFKKKYKNKLDELSNERKIKSKLLDRIKIELNNNSLNYINRVSAIKKIFSLKDNYSKKSRRESCGYNDSKFIFEREVIVEKMLDYLFRIFNEYIDSTKLKTNFGIDKTKMTSMIDLIKVYCFFIDDAIMSSKKVEDLDNEIFNLSNLKIEIKTNIFYKKSEVDGEQSLRELSPGTKANLLMEYIVFKESSIPLIIDQPEDNIDNRTIYNVLTQWFEDLKSKRQVIVATHDPNIVVNADAENIIICNQIETDVFSYEFGALEYGDNLKTISTILDGGSIALERRLLKYGEN